jgi:membrane protease YdiL (CAAX protease family)
MNKRLLAMEMALLFAAFFLTGFVGQGIESLEPGRDFRFVDISRIAASYVIMGIPQILLILYIIDIQGNGTLADFGVVPLRRSDPLMVLAVLAGALAIAAPAFLLPDVLPDGGLKWRLENASDLPSAFALCLISGYREELFFRAYLLTRLGQIGVPAGFAVAGSSLLFSLGHLYEGPIAVAVTAVQGVYLSLIFMKRKSLHVISFAHGAYNFTLLCLSLAAGSISP